MSSCVCVILRYTTTAMYSVTRHFANKLIYCLVDPKLALAAYNLLLAVTQNLTEWNSPGCLASKHNHIAWKCHNSVLWKNHISWKYRVSSCENATSHLMIISTIKNISYTYALFKVAVVVYTRVYECTTCVNFTVVD